MGRMQRRKGADFENLICRAFGGWWGCVFKRTTTNRGAGKSGLHGDIVPINPPLQFPFSVECKDQKGWTFDQLIYSPEKAILAGFLKQAYVDAVLGGWVPLLVCKQPFHPPVALTPAPLPGSAARLVLVLAPGLIESVFVLHLKALTALTPGAVRDHAKFWHRGLAPSLAGWAAAYSTAMAEARAARPPHGKEKTSHASKKSCTRRL